MSGIMTSQRLESCEAELNVLLEDLQSTVSYQLPSKYGEDRRRTLQTLEKKMRESEDMLRDLQLEVRKAPKSYQQQISSRITRYRTDLISLRRQLTSTGSMREELFSREDDDQYASDPRRGEQELLLKNTETLKRASASLYRAQQVSAQTDEIADNVVVELDDQRASLLRTRNRVHGIDTEMDRTTTLLRQIVCKGMQNRLILIVIIIMELLILAGVTYWKFFS